MLCRAARVAAAASIDMQIEEDAAVQPGQEGCGHAAGASEARPKCDALVSLAATLHRPTKSKASSDVTELMQHLCHVGCLVNESHLLPEIGAVVTVLAHAPSTLNKPCG